MGKSKKKGVRYENLSLWYRSVRFFVLLTGVAQTMDVTALGEFRG